jgi:hypothetical protein
VHVAIAASTAACVAPALLIDSLGGMARESIFIVLTQAGGFSAIALVTYTVLKWCRRRRPFHGPALSGSLYETLLAGITGLCLGAYTGTMHDAEVGGIHFSALVGYFGLLPVALLMCCSRRPAWRPFLDVTILMAGVEIGAQVGMMLTKHDRWYWWDDITGIDLAYWAGGMVAAVFWMIVQRKGLSVEEALRVRRMVEDGEELPPRKGR